MITTVSQLERTTTDDVVTTAHTRDADSPTLVAYADLTEATVVGWLTLDEGLEANLLAQIEEQKNPTSATGLAW